MRADDFGATGLRVSKLGLGAGQIGGDDLDEREVENLLHGALDAGVTLIDTARSYGRSEERIARHLGGRRHEFVLSSKGGYGIDGVADWTGEAVTRGVDAALVRLGTDVIDIFHLHSCPQETLERGDVVQALTAAVRAGKVRVAAYSGENDALLAAARSGAFGALMCSVNLVDQRSLSGAVAEAARGGVAVIGKRPLANACWRFSARPVADYGETYWCRMVTLRERLGDADWPNLAIRFAAFAPGVSSVVVGTRNLEHLQQCAAALAEGPLAPPLTEEIRAWFGAHDRDWTGQI
jgi:aryl-alcohol dehydrogenase-like predicted oxidoreductase